MLDGDGRGWGVKSAVVEVVRDTLKCGGRLLPDHGSFSCAHAAYRIGILIAAFTSPSSYHNARHIPHRRKTSSAFSRLQCKTLVQCLLHMFSHSSSNETIEDHQV